MKVLGSLLLTFLIIAVVHCDDDEKEKEKFMQIITECRKKADNISQEDFYVAYAKKNENYPKAKEVCVCGLCSYGLCTDNKPNKPEIVKAMKKHFEAKGKGDAIEKCLTETDDPCDLLFGCSIKVMQEETKKD